jgi:hypothetical protein
MSMQMVPRLSVEQMAHFKAEVSQLIPRNEKSEPTHHHAAPWLTWAE